MAETGPPFRDQQPGQAERRAIRPVRSRKFAGPVPRLHAVGQGACAELHRSGPQRQLFLVPFEIHRTTSMTNPHVPGPPKFTGRKDPEKVRHDNASPTSAA